MSNFSKSLSQTWLKEDKLRNTEELLTKHLGDNFFVDYFNVFLNLPVFGQRVLFKLHERRFIFNPTVFEAVDYDRVVAWLAARRFHLFTKTHLFLEYQLCHKLRNLDFELRLKDLDCDRQTHHALKVFANNLLGSVVGMYLFREHLRASSGLSVFGCWLHVQRFRQTRVLKKRREIFHEIQHRYLHAKAVDKLSNTLCRVATLDLLSFPVVPDSETELSAQLMTTQSVPSCEVDLSSSEALAQVHRVLLEALRSYWAPCYVMHVLSTQPFSMLEELFKVPTGSVIQNLTDMKMLIRRCSLFKVSGDLKHDTYSGKDEWSMPSISISSSTLSQASLSSTDTTNSSQESTFACHPYLQTMAKASRSSALAIGHHHLATKDQLHPEDIGFIGPKLPSMEIAQGQDSQSLSDTSDDDLTEVCDEEELLDTESFYDYPEQESRRHEEKKEVKVSDELEDDDDSQVRLNLMRLALKEMALKPEPMLYLNHLLRHYLFGYRHLDQEEPVTDRRTLCLLACDDLAGSPFRSYLRGQDLELDLSYFDFWSAMRRYQQLHDLKRMGEIMNTKNCSMIDDAHRKNILYMVSRFLMNSGVDANILEYNIRLSLLEDIRKARWSPLINSTLDVVSNVLSIPITQFILYDRQDFRKHADSQAEDIIASGLPMQIPSVLRSLLKRRSKASSLQTFADCRCLSDPWREDPKQDPDGDMECLRPTDPRGTEYDGVVGVLGEQHRLLAFQFLIVLREDLPDAQVCGMASLARIVRSDYGSLHILFSAPVNHKFLASLRPKQRMPRATLLRPSPLMEVKDFLVPVITRLGPMQTLTMNDLLEYRRKRMKLELKLPKTPRTFFDILADEMQFIVFKKYLELKGLLKPVAFVEDVQDILRLKNQAEKETMVDGIVEQFFGDGERSLNFGEELPMTVRTDESPNLKNLRSAQLALEKQIEKTWFKKYAEELELQKVDLPPPDKETNKEDWLENCVLVQEEKRRVEEKEKTRKMLMKLKREKQNGKVEEEKRKVKKDKREKHTGSMVVDESEQSQETIKDLKRKEENEESLESKKKNEKKEDKEKTERTESKEKEEREEGKGKKERKEYKKREKRKESPDMLEDLEEGKYKKKKENSRERKKTQQAKEGKNEVERMGEEDNAEERSLPAHGVKHERKIKKVKQESGDQVHKDKEVRDEKEFKDQEEENEIKSVSGTESEEEQNQEANKSGEEKLDQNRQIYEDYEQEKIQKKNSKEDDKRTLLGTSSLNQITSKRQAEILKKEEEEAEEEEEEVKEVEDNEKNEDHKDNVGDTVKEEVKEELKKRKETSPGTTLNQMISRRQAEISKEEEEIKEENKRDMKMKKSMQDEVYRLKISDKEKEEKKADTLRSEKVADEKNLAEIKSQTPTDAQAHKDTSRILKPHNYSSSTTIQEEIHKGKETKSGYQTKTEFLLEHGQLKNMEYSPGALKEEIHKGKDEKGEYQTETDFSPEQEQLQNMVYSVESIKEEIRKEKGEKEEYQTETEVLLKHEQLQKFPGALQESLKVVNDRAKSLTGKAIDLWRNVVKKMVKFTRSLNIPLERKLFEMYLKQELQNAKDNLTADKECRTTDSEGIEQVVYTRQILNDLLIQVNKLPADLRFFVEADRFKKQMISHLNCSTKIGVPIEKQIPILGMRADAIIQCFFQSVCEPVVQVNLCSEKNISQIKKSKSKGLTVDLFHDIYTILYPLLFKMWEIFANQWLSRLRVKQRKQTIQMLLASFKDPIIGDFPHPNKPSADYLHLTLSDYKYSRMTDKEVRGCFMKFSIHRGIHLLVNEAEQKKSKQLSGYKLPAIKVNINNSCKESVAKNLEKEKKRNNVFCKTQYHEQQKVYRSKNCPGNSDAVGSEAKLPALVKTLECRERKSDFGIEERGQKHKPKPGSKQKGESYSEAKVCSESNGLTSGHMGDKNTEEEINVKTSTKKNQISNHTSERRETKNKQRPKFRGGDKRRDNNSSQKFTKRADRGTNTLQTEMRQRGKQKRKMQAANCTLNCVSGESEELQLMSPVYLSRSLPTLDGCLQLQDSQSVWGPGKGAFKGDYAVQVNRMITLLYESRQGSL